MSSFNMFGTGFGCGFGDDFKCSSSLPGKRNILAKPQVGFYPLGLQPKRTILAKPQVGFYPLGLQPKRTILAPKIISTPTWIPSVLWRCDDMKSEAPRMPRGIRNNNPGNIKDFGIPWKGLVGKDDKDF